MTQYVFSNEMVAHVWAQQRQDSGRSNNGQFYFQGRKLYSYGSHFLVGYVVAPGAVFLNSDGYSPTTGKHKGEASHATSHYSERFHVPGLTQFADYLDAITAHRRVARKGAELKALQARTEKGAAIIAETAPDAARWMLSQVGLKAERLDVITRRLERERAAKLKADTREAVATWRRDGRELSELSSRDFAARINAIRFQESTYRADSDLEALSRRLERAHKQAGADGHTRRRATLWTRLKAVRAARKAMAPERGSYVNTGKLAQTVRAVSVIREFLAGTAAGRVPGPRAFGIVQGHLTTVLELGHASPATRAALEALRARCGAAREALELEANRARFQAEREARESWIAGEGWSGGNRARLSDERGGALVRAVGAELDGCRVIAGDLETSHGARVPLRHAAAVFAYVRRIKESAESQGILDDSTVWRAGQGGRTIRVGHFTVDEITARGDFVAGCHRIHWSETERLARELGLWTCDTAALEALDAAELA